MQDCRRFPDVDMLESQLPGAYEGPLAPRRRGGRAGGEDFMSRTKCGLSCDSQGVSLGRVIDSTRVFRVFVLAYCVWQSSDLLLWWRPSSTEFWGWLLFGIWLVPAAVGAIRGRGEDRPQTGLLVAALVFALIGQITWLNVLQHVALALAIAGWRQPLRGQWVWLAAAVLWMPASGWLLAGVAGGWEMMLRLGGIVAVSGGVMAVWRRVQVVAVVGLALVVAGSGVAARADTFTYSPVQSTVRPLGLSIVDRVALAGSDAASADFQSNVLPTLQPLVTQNLSGIVPGVASGNFVALNPGSLTLAAAADVRVYFVGEDTGYHNSLGFTTGGAGLNPENNPLLIFPDATLPSNYGSSPNAKRTQTSPLFPGDFVNLGSMAAGTELDFFLIANGDNNGENIFWTDSSMNPDGTDRAVALVAFAQADSPYVLVGFEDKVSDSASRDFSDVLFAVYVGEANVAAMLAGGGGGGGSGVPAPEPGLLWLLVAGCGAWLHRVRRRRAAEQREVERPVGGLQPAGC